MIGYKNPEEGNQRRKALAQFLKGQSQQRASSASRMKAFGRTAGAGTGFQRGGGKSAPEKFGFAGRKPSLKTLLGLVGENMGYGGMAAARFFSPDLPVGGLGWGGQISPQPDGGAMPFDPTSPIGGNPYGGDIALEGEGGWTGGYNQDGSVQSLPTYSTSPSGGGGMLPGLGSFWAGLPNASGPFTGPANGALLPSYGGGGYTSPQKPLLGDLLYGDLRYGAF